jgi:hypothetical protein
VHHGCKFYQRLFDDLSLKTYNAFQGAPELRGSPATPPTPHP